MEELMPLVYDQLRSLASRYMRQERQGHTLNATALVHQAYLKLPSSEVSWEVRAHFMARAAERRKLPWNSCCCFKCP